MMTKITRITALMLALLLILTGCSGSTGENTTTAAADSSTIAKEDRETLTVYVLTQGGADPFAVYAKSFGKQNNDWLDVQVEAFSDSESLEERLKVELPAGQGPDVIVGSFPFGLDMMNLAENGAFCDMTDTIAADESFNNETYYTAVMKAGQIADRQYIIPLRFSIPMFASTASTFAELGIDWENTDQMQNYRKILEFLKANEEPQIVGWGNYYDLAPALMCVSGIDPADYGDSYTMDDENIRLMLELSAEMYRDAKELDKTLSYMGSSFHYEVGKLPLYYSHLGVSSQEFVYLYSGYSTHERGEDFTLYFPTENENGSIHALGLYFAAVTSTAENPQTAWLLLRYLMDYPWDIGAPGFPLSRPQVEVMMDTISSVYGQEGDLTVRSLPKVYIEQLLDALDRVTDASIEQFAGIWKFLAEAMQSIATGEADLDAAIEQMSNQIDLYVNE